MPTPLTTLEKIRRLLADQQLAALATQDDSGPYLSLMAFAVSRDLDSLLIATKRGTRKFANILKNPKVALLIDNRTAGGADLNNTMALTILGTAQEPEEEEKAFLTERFRKQHPGMQVFLDDPGCILLEIKTEKYILISQLEESETISLTG